MDEKYLKAFNAITGFVSDLFEVFGNTEKKENEKVTPLALYHRFLGHVKFSDRQAINSVVKGFQDFCKEHRDVIHDDKLCDLDENARIIYSKKIYIDIERYLRISDADTRRAIRTHLLSISVTLDPTPETIAELKGVKEMMELDANSSEGQFISGIFEKTQGIMSGADNENPMAAIAQLFQSGIITDMVGGLQQGTATGELDPAKLLGSMQSMLGNLMKPQ